MIWFHILLHFEYHKSYDIDHMTYQNITQEFEVI